MSVAVGNQELFVNEVKKRVYRETIGNRDLVVLEAIITVPSSRRQGKATKVLQDILAATAKAQIPLVGQPLQMSQHVSEANPGPTTKQLISWYRKLGFSIVDDGLLITNGIPISNPLED